MMKILARLLAVGAIALTACQSAPARSLDAASAAPAVLAASPAAKPLTLVAMGASDVVGVGATNPASEGWAPMLAGMLPGKVTLEKLGGSGGLASQLRQEALSRAVALSPGLVVIWTGTNDFNAGVPLASFEKDLGAMLRVLAETDARIVVLNLPELDRMPAFREHGALIRQALPAWQEAVRRQGARHGATVIDMASYASEVEAHPEYLASDGFHPSTTGYRRLAAIIAATL